MYVMPRAGQLGLVLHNALAQTKSDSCSFAPLLADLPGWPLFSPPKMQLTKCAKCPREFCSSVAFRRHSRVHRRALKIDKVANVVRVFSQLG
jgi:hypothetical protein